MRSQASDEETPESSYQGVLALTAEDAEWAQRPAERLSAFRQLVHHALNAVSKDSNLAAGQSQV